MIVQAFPDLRELKQKISERFRSRIGCNGLRLETEGFPSIIIHAQSREAYRPDITGPISLFMNLSGQSRCSVEGRTVTIPEDCFFLTNRFQDYTLEIGSRRPVETFNIHLGEYFSEGVLGSLVTPADTILNDGQQQKPAAVTFQNRLYRKDAVLRQFIQTLRTIEQGERFNRLLFEETLSDLLKHLLLQHRDLVRTIQKMPALKQSTRVELYRRLTRSLDYLHSASAAEIDLETLAAAACLSKYHYLRLFRQAFGLSPYQYLQDLRLEKAKELLQHSDLPVGRIAEALGFENSSSFSRLFRRREKLYPAQYRAVRN